MNNDMITIFIDGTPGSALSPNRPRGMHWSKTHAAKQALVAATKSAFWSWNTEWNVNPPVNVTMTVFWEKGRKRMDGDNLLASLKAMIDVIAEYTGINDKHFIFQPIEQKRDKSGRGHMIVTLEGA